MYLQDFGVNSGNVRITDLIDQAEDATRSGSRVPAALDDSEPSLDGSSDSESGEYEAEVLELENVPDREQRQVITEDSAGNGRGSGSVVARDSDYVNTHPETTALIAHTQSNDPHFAALESTSIDHEQPEFSGSSEVIAPPVTDDKFVPAFALILYFLVASTTLVCYVAAATALIDLIY